MIKTAQKTFARRNELAELYKKQSVSKSKCYDDMITEFNPTGDIIYNLVEYMTIREVEQALKTIKLKER